MTATRLEAIAGLPEDAARLFLTALQMPDPREWPKVPSPDDNVGVAMIAGQVVVGEIPREPPQVDLLELERARQAEQRDTQLREQFVPSTRWFTGRHTALTTLAEWLTSPPGGPGALVVTGHAGSGKTALLGLAAALSDPDQAPSVPHDGLPDAFHISDGAITEAIYARTMTTEQIRDRIAAMAGLHSDTVQGLLDGLRQRAGAPLVVLIDALDEAANPDGLITGLLNPLIGHGAGSIRLLLGTRPHLLSTRLLGQPGSGRYVLLDLDSEIYADPGSIRAYIQRILLSYDSLDSSYKPSGGIRTAPEDVVCAVAEAIGQAAGTSFLVARITATTEATADRLPDSTDPVWRAALPRRAGQAMQRDLRLRLGAEAGKAERLLLPLAYAQGDGLPWENIWPHLVQALSPGSGYGNDDLVWLRRVAGSYVVEALTGGRSVYRLYHQALAEHLLERRDQRADQQAIADSLVALVPPRAGGGRDWPAAHSYTRTHLATHAACGRHIDNLLADPAYLLIADRPQLLAGLGAAVSVSARLAADAYRRAAPHLRAARAREHASYLQLAARCGRAPALAARAENCRSQDTWSAEWASWRHETHHRVLTGHIGTVGAVAVAELEGRPVIISASADQTVRMWDLATGTPVGGPFTGHTGAVTAVAVAELEGRPVIISASADQTVRVWDLATGTPVGGPFTGHTGAVTAVAVAELEGRPVIISASADQTVRVWDLATGTPVGGPFTGHTGAVTAVAAGGLEGRPVVVSGSSDRSVRVWDLATGTPVGDPFTGHTGWVNAVAVGDLAGRPVVVSGSLGRSLRVWDLGTGAPVGGPVVVGGLAGLPMADDPFSGNIGS